MLLLVLWGLEFLHLLPITSHVRNLQVDGNPLLLLQNFPINLQSYAIFLGLIFDHNISRTHYTMLQKKKVSVPKGRPTQCGSWRHTKQLYVGQFFISHQDREIFGSKVSKFHYISVLFFHLLWFWWKILKFIS